MLVAQSIYVGKKEVAIEAVSLLGPLYIINKLKDCEEMFIVGSSSYATDCFTIMEDSSLLDPINERHLYALQYNFLP